MILAATSSAGAIDRLRSSRDPARCLCLTPRDSTGKPPDRRKLIAVVYADMVGYSRLIGLDDAGTLERLRTLRSTLIDPTIAEHGGRIVNTGGDSLLMVFDSVDGAVRCAMRVQQQVPVCDGEQPSIGPFASASVSTLAM